MAAGPRSALVLGGAGFVGSHIVRRLVAGGAAVTVIDGLIEGTGGKRENLAPVASAVRLLAAPVEEVGGLAELVRDSDVIIDAMAWTSHLAALQAPEKDLRLNAASHLALIRHLPAQTDSRVLFLGSRSQYGNPAGEWITEDTPMRPEDVQGIHKLAAEGYYRVYAGLWGLNVVSLRFPNCFGPRQRTEGEDIGLIGQLIRMLLDDQTVTVYEHRRRAVVYAPDVAEVVCRLATAPASAGGFRPFNLAGIDVSIEELVQTIIRHTGRGGYRILPAPPDLAAIDSGRARLAEDRLRAALGEIARTDLDEALALTVEYFESMRP
jgi:UDP-glucose 4-epimerase